MSLLKVENLSIGFETRRGILHVIDDLSFALETGRTLGIVGESGSGKSVTSLAVMGLLPPTARVLNGSIEFAGANLLQLSETELQKMRGRDIGMIFQDPMTSLNPSFTVGFQLQEALRIHHITAGKTLGLEEQAAELLTQVGIPDARERLRAYPHQLSGGMSQRVMIAMAIACSPKLLIADEPTTALDVTIQAQILELLKSLQRERKMSLILVTHDIGVVAQMADEIMVMYAGQAVERGPTQQVIQAPRHPYTAGLLASLPSRHGLNEFRTRLPTIGGMVPDLSARPKGCQLHPRCSYADELCRTDLPENTYVQKQMVKCHRPLKEPAP